MKLYCKLITFILEIVDVSLAVCHAFEHILYMLKCEESSLLIYTLGLYPKEGIPKENLFDLLSFPIFSDLIFC
jgi:hypothetical protein